MMFRGVGAQHDPFLQIQAHFFYTQMSSMYDQSLTFDIYMFYT